ncbi:MAG: hypothetical protein AB7P03_02900 [Kofleriaceae bacterium]
MRSSLLVIGSLLVCGSTSLAQPIEPTAGPCSVSIARAPDDVREVIEAWVRNEPRCGTALELRVIPTDTGYYLFARTDDGRVYERVVPDAQSAGVLVASWAAEDRVEVANPPANAAANLQVKPPASRAVVSPPSSVRVVASPARTPHRDRGSGSLMVSGTVLLGDDIAGNSDPDGAQVGVRAELELVRRGGVSLGTLMTASRASYYLSNGAFGADVDGYNLRALGVFALSSTFDKANVRFALGVGAAYTRVEGEFLSGWGDSEPSYMHYRARNLGATADLSLLFTARINPTWGVVFGPAATFMHPDIDERMGYERPVVELLLAGGVQRFW